MIKIKMLKHATCVLLLGQQVYPNRDGVTTILFTVGVDYP